MVPGVNGRPGVPVQIPVKGQRLDLKCVNMMNQAAKDTPAVLTKK